MRNLINLFRGKRKMSKVDVINDTVAFYSEDTSRRSFVGEGFHQRCKYNGPDGKKCAFARFVDGTVDESLEGKSAGDVIENGIKLKPEVAHIEDIPFWNGIQGLHDYGRFWDDKGLTEKGKKMVEQLLEEYKD